MHRSDGWGDEMSLIVLMSTYNGEKYLAEQLKSIDQQEGVAMSVMIRDDGSKDHTLSILSSWKEKVQEAIVGEGNSALSGERRSCQKLYAPHQTST